MAQVAVSISRAFSRSSSFDGSSTTLPSSSSTSLKSLSFVGSKEVRGGDLFRPRSGKKSGSKVQSEGSTTAARQVRASATKWINSLFGQKTHQDDKTSIMHQDDKNSVLYKGIATIAKKRAQLSNLVQFDLVDRQADFEDNAAELIGKKIEIQLVSQDLDPKTNAPKVSAKSIVQDWLTNAGEMDLVADEYFYTINFTVPKDFGQPGACIIKNNHPNEFYIMSLALQSPDQTTFEFPANAWVYNTKKYPTDRVFFTNKVYLPSGTPQGLKVLREQELEQTRGNGTGERQPWDRIYDYDVYNDLGNPDKDISLKRPVLGGSKEFPYPRRVRTGRPMTKKDPKSESPVQGIISIPYIPSDEHFLRTKDSTFVAVLIKGALHAVIPTLENIGADSFKSIQEVEDLYNNGLPVQFPPNTIDTSALTPEAYNDPTKLVYLSTLLEPKGEDSSVLHYAVPQVFAADKNAWRVDEEFGRQALAGIHPLVIERVKTYPPKSTLDPAEYGEGSALKDEHILPYLESYQTVREAIEAKKLFTVDYHDAILPFLKVVNVDEEFGYKAYATRTIFFNNKKGEMKPIAIELSLPPAQAGGAASNRVFTAADSADYLWQLAKTHASAIDFNFHEVISHFGFTHGCVEPFIIASHRQLSKLHPIMTLLTPYFKDNMSINAAARAALINAKGVVELDFSMGRHAFEVGSKGYDAFWRFDTQGLPQNLIARGMAEPADSSLPGSVKLVVEDYPYAKDGLEIWAAINEWVSKYVDITYQGSDEAIKTDSELQAWWNEIVNVGHGDFKDATWWPKLDSTKNLVQIITTIAWVAGPVHAALNFGQYSYAGFPLNKPSGTRKLVPEKGSPEYQQLQKDPEKFYMSTITAPSKALSVMTTIELLATHSLDEEYIGTRNSTNWTSDPQVKAAFSVFSQRIAAVEENIKKRNADDALVNRLGPAKVPYTLLSPSSTSGLTGRGVPNSVSI